MNTLTSVKNLQPGPVPMAMKAKLTSLILFVGLSLCHLSCGERLRPPRDAEIIGIYAARYPAGEVETLELNEDGTAKQAVYSSRQEYLKGGKSIHHSVGKWERKKQTDNRIEIKPQFEHFEIMPSGEVKLRIQPEKIDEGFGVWVGDQEYGKTSDCMIYYNLDCGIILNKVTNRSAEFRLLGH